jgi:hypothetical protein
MNSVQGGGEISFAVLPDGKMVNVRAKHVVLTLNSNNKCVEERMDAQFTR